MAKPDPEKLRKSLHASVDKYVKQQARNTIALNAERDPACEGYARVPGPDACDFCITMGAHNHFYKTRETAGGGVGHGSADDRYHPYCNCPVVIVFRKDGKLVARDPETGEPVPYDAAGMVRRYREAGAPTFEKNRAREAARRRADRAAGVRFDPGGKQARKAGANTGAKLAQADFDAAMKELAGAGSLDELHAVGARIVKDWPKDAEGLRHRGQWAELSKLAKSRERELKRELSKEPALSVEVDRLAPCLIRLSDEETVKTVVSRVSPRDLTAFTEENGWYINWSEVPNDVEIYKLTVEGSQEIEGLVSLREDRANQAVEGLWAVAAPHNQAKRVGKKNKKYDGVGGHLFAVMEKRSVDLGYNGYVRGKAANYSLMSYYKEEFGAIQLGRTLFFYINDDEAAKLLGKYTWTET